MQPLLFALLRLLPLPLYGTALVGISLTLREHAAGRPWPVALAADGIALTAPLPHFAAWTNERGPELLGMSGPLIILPLAVLLLLGMHLGGFHRSLLGRIALVSIAVGAGTNTIEAALTGGVVDYVWIEPFKGQLVIFNSSDVFLVLGLVLLVVSLLVDEWAVWATRRGTPRD